MDKPNLKVVAVDFKPTKKYLAFLARLEKKQENDRLKRREREAKLCTCCPIHGSGLHKRVGR
jgi:hypothetical protein